MPSLLHEVLADIVRKHPYVAAVLVEQLTGLPLSAMEASNGDPNWSELEPPELRADLVLELRESGRSDPSRALIIEVQLGRDEGKRFAWPTYVAGLRRRLSCPVLLVVLAPDPAIAKWCRRPIALDELSHSVGTPLVIGPSSIPEVTRRADAAARPELAVLSAIAHGEGPRAVSIARAALRGFAGLDDARARLYSDLVVLHLRDAARAKLETLMNIEHYDYESDIAKKLIAHGQAKGQAEGELRGKIEGKIEGKVEAVLLVLSGRGLMVPGGLRQALGELPSEELDEVLRRSAIVASAEELLER